MPDPATTLKAGPGRLTPRRGSGSISGGVVLVLMISPRSDPRFILTAEALVAGGVDTAMELQHRLRERYPGAVVRRRALDGERSSTWYVYRDGTWSSDGVVRRVVRGHDGRH